MIEDASPAKVYVFPVSFPQQRLWVLDQIEPGNPAYNVPVAVRLKGTLNEFALRESLSGVIRRHEALRTVFAEMDGEPVQAIKPEMQLHLPTVDLGGLCEPAREIEALNLAKLDFSRAFDLRQGPLWRFKLMRIGKQDHLLLMALHHIICDGWSLGILMREMSSLYESFLKGEPSHLPELRIQYADFAAWQREWLQGEVLEEELSYWRRQLGGDLPVLQLPTDRPRPPLQTFRGASQSFALPKGLTEGLKTLGQQEGATAFMVLLASLGVLLSRYSQQNDITIGAPIANRSHEEIEDVIGCFVNTLVMRLDMSGDLSFRELLARVREVVLAAHAHQSTPLEKLVEVLQPSRDLSRPPLFQVMLSLQMALVPTLHLPNLILTPIKIDAGTAELDLLFFIDEKDQQFSGWLQYNTDIFESSTIKRMLAHFQKLLESAIGATEQPVSTWMMLTEAEQYQLLVEWNDTVGMYSRDKCIHELFEDQVKRTPDAIALAHKDEQLTYNELNVRANNLAHHLRSFGTGPDATVAICMERSPEIIIAFLGVLKAGGAYVPLDPAYPKERLTFMLEDSKAQILLTQQRLLDLLTGQSKRVICIDSDWEVISRECGDNPIRGAIPANLVYMIYTSGSTGKPKGTMIQHGSLVNYTQTVITGYGVEPDDRVLQFCSISFDISAEEIYPCLTCGATLVLRTDSMLDSVATFLRRCQDWGVTMLSLPTAYWHEITAGLGTEGSVLPPSLRVIIIAGERAIPERLVKWRKHAGRRPRLINTYGVTEATIISTLKELTDFQDTDWREVPIGRSIQNNQLFVVDKHMQPVPIGVQGELCLGGLALARGYFNQSDLTAEKFIPNPFGNEIGTRLYKAGDVAKYLPDGDIEFMGRNDNQIKIRGFRVELSEVESVLSRHPKLRDAVVMVREDAPGEKRLLAYVVSDEKELLTINELSSYLRQELPHYMVPSEFTILNALPLTPNGKVDRTALLAMSAIRPTLGVAYAPPRTELERAITTIWEELLQVKNIGIHDNFFDLGGHSLLMIKLRNRLREVCHREVSMVELFKHSTINSFAQHLRQNEKNHFQIKLPQEGAESRIGARKQRKQMRRTAILASKSKESR